MLANASCVISSCIVVLRVMAMKHNNGLNHGNLKSTTASRLCVSAPCHSCVELSIGFVRHHGTSRKGTMGSFLHLGTEGSTDSRTLLKGTAARLVK